MTSKLLLGCMSLSQNRCALLGDMHLVKRTSGGVDARRHRFSKRSKFHVNFVSGRARLTPS
ncbi:hypothetical protein, partial [Mesorhizobium sanjuanii]|uniref:hypothetical protein n=1 Tax=Mesorhizobium sanjuanii TaxID=2037900 RepID=UPI001AD83C49